MSEELVRLEITAQEEDYEGITGLLCLKLSSGWEEHAVIPSAKAITAIAK